MERKRRGTIENKAKARARRGSTVGGDSVLEEWVRVVVEEWGGGVDDRTAGWGERGNKGD